MAHLKLSRYSQIIAQNAHNTVGCSLEPEGFISFQLLQFFCQENRPGYDWEVNGQHSSVPLHPFYLLHMSQGDVGKSNSKPFW